MAPAYSRFCVSLVLAFALTAACSQTSTVDDTAPHDTGGTSTGGASAGGASAGGSSGVDTAGAPSSGAGNGGASDAPAEPPFANVTAVAASGDPGSYTFDVSVESSDIDCSQFADWWEVLTTDGALVYRRILDHSHTDANGTSDANAPGNTFTRSGGPVPIQESDVVIVRAHMSVGGYNGAVMRGSAADGFTQAPDIGSDFAPNVETEAPLPTGCEF